MLESGPFVWLSANAGSKREAIRGGINSLPEPPDNRREDLAAGDDPARRQRGRSRVLMTNEPRTYREGIAAVIGQLRPTVEVETVEPSALDYSIKRFSPDIVTAARPRRY